MKNHTLQVRVNSETELRLRNYQLREKRDRSDALRRLIEDALDAEDRKLVDSKVSYGRTPTGERIGHA